MRIAIIGATGMLGQPVAHKFIQAGFPVRIVARDVTAAKPIFPDSDVVAGDLRDPKSLANALRGIDTVYLNLSVKQIEKPVDFHTEAEGLVQLIRIAHQTGVRRIAYLSSLVMRYQGMNDFDWWVFKVKQEAVRLIKISGIPYTIFYPSCFMESLLVTQRVGSIILLVGRSDVRPWYIAARDYGDQVVRALQQVKDGENQEYVIQGPEAVTQHEAANRVVAAYQPEHLRTLTVPPVMMRFGRLFSPQADYGWHITEALNKYSEVFEAQQTWSDLGKPITSLEEFAVRG